MALILIGDVVEENGRTIRENNMARPHNIPVGTLVEVKWNEWHGDGACEKIHARLWVTKHDRDCDGTPLYCLGRAYGSWRTGGLVEADLTPVTVTDAIRAGEGVLEWPEAT